MTKKTKLELTWPGKEERPKLEPRILIEDPTKSYHAKVRREGDLFDNMLIKGDNLLALKALEQDHAGMVKCVFIDPPYNTGSAFTHYDDGLEHSTWLSLLKDRLQTLRGLLSDEGSLWVTIDDGECHYLKIICDEVFGRMNFVANVVWQKKASPQANAIWLSDSHDHILVYAKNKSIWRPNLLPRSEEAVARYRNPDHDARGPWTSGDCTISLTGGQRGAQFARTGVSSNIYEIVTPSGRRVMPPAGTCWRFSEARFAELVADGRIWFGENGSNVPRYKRFLADVQDGVVPLTWWSREEVGDNQESKREVTTFNSKDIFATPKPERLLHRILHLATRPGDLVLDSFAGSGTTGAVAHKMGRRWIMVELGKHSDTHIMPRLQKVVDGTDRGGVTTSVNWSGGGGFRYYTLAPSLLEQDRHGNWVISRDYNPAMLAEAMCKHMGFAYEPSQEVYWQQGRSTERDFIYVTTQSLSAEALKLLSAEVGPERSLLVCCKAYETGGDSFDNITVVKIPSAILAKCEWGRDDYSLNIANLPMAEDASPAQGDLLAETEAGDD
jgi:adenine-specific DNA-methyltransferase